MSDLPIHDVAFPRPPAPGLRGWLAKRLSLQAQDTARICSIEKLASYDDRLLADIGVTREQVLGRSSGARRPSMDWLTLKQSR
jgi:uncharacterized protein YjiS (DUF1127 family)